MSEPIPCVGWLDVDPAQLGVLVPGELEPHAGRVEVGSVWETTTGARIPPGRVLVLDVRLEGGVGISVVLDKDARVKLSTALLLAETTALCHEGGEDETASAGREEVPPDAPTGGVG